MPTSHTDTTWTVFDDQCAHDITEPDRSDFDGPAAFWVNYIRSGSDFAALYLWALVPLYFAAGIANTVLKVLLLNPPIPGLHAIGLMRAFTFETALPLPGDTLADRAAFAKRWYSTEPRPAPFEGNAVQSRFTYLPHRGMWMEKLAFYPLLVLPAQSASSRYREDGTAGDASGLGYWVFSTRIWHPHALNGWVRAGENPRGTGWLLAGEFNCWFFLEPFYKFLVRRLMQFYSEQILAAEERAAAT